MSPKIPDHLYRGHFVSGSGGLGTRLPRPSQQAPGVAGQRDIDHLCCRSFDGYYERSGKCREPSRMLVATSEA